MSAQLGPPQEVAADYIIHTPTRKDRSVEVIRMAIDQEQFFTMGKVKEAIIILKTINASVAMTILQSA